MAHGTWKQTGGGGGGEWIAPLVGLGCAAGAAAAACAVVAAILPTLLLILAIALGTGVVIIACAVAWRIHHGPRAERVPPWQRGAQQLPQTRQAVADRLERGQRAELPPAGQGSGLHLHLHGVTAEDVAAIIERQRRRA